MSFSYCTFVYEEQAADRKKKDSYLHDQGCSRIKQFQDHQLHNGQFKRSFLDPIMFSGIVSPQRNVDLPQLDRVNCQNCKPGKFEMHISENQSTSICQIKGQSLIFHSC